MVSDLTFFAQKRCKIAAAEKSFFSSDFFSFVYSVQQSLCHQSPMSKLFRHLESLEKSNGNKLSEIWTFLLKNGVQSLRHFFFFTVFCHLLTPFKDLFDFTPRSPMSNCFRFLDSLGKSYGKKWYQIVKLSIINGLKSPRKKKFSFLANCVF